MAHFAKLDENNVVVHVSVVNNIELNNLEFPESEPLGILFLQSIYGQNTSWKQTSYNKKFRKNYAGIGFVYDESRDAFIPPKPFNSWLLNEEKIEWEPPINYPSDGKIYIWNENSISWVEVKNDSI